MSAEPTVDPAPGNAATDAEDPEVKWLREVYRGDESRQLTIRAVIAGMLLGGVMSLSNLYIALKTGWSFGVTITAGILAFVIFGILKRIGLVRTEFGMLENNAMQSVASAAGYMTGGGTVAAIPALMMLTHTVVPGYVIFLWITTIAMLGVFMAIPMKRQMINQEQLRFPSGIAAAETLRGLHPHDRHESEKKQPSEGETYRDTASQPSDGEKQAKALLWSGVGGAVLTWWREAHAKWLFYPKIPEGFGFPFKIHGIAAAKWTLSMETSLLLLASGAIMGWRAAWSMAVGAVLQYGFLAPYGHKIGAITAVSYKGIVNWTVWFGSSLLLTSGLLTFAFSWKQIARAFGDLGKLFGKKETAKDPLADVEVPTRWFMWGVLALTPLVIVFGSWFFQIQWWMSLFCIVLSFFLAIVAARATGETDTTPTGALGKITQLSAGVLARGSVTTNLMSASISAGTAIHCADLLTDLKSGYLLGAKPRQQFIAQFFGVIAGSAFVVPAYRLLVPDYTVVGTPAIPAPGALSWASVAQVLAGGIGRLPVTARWLIAIGGGIGIVMVLIERALPKHKKYLPSAIGFGLAFTLPASNTISMFLGAVIALMIEKRNRPWADRYIVPVSSGIIAGESLIGILIKALVITSILKPG